MVLHFHLQKHVNNYILFKQEKKKNRPQGLLFPVCAHICTPKAFFVTFIETTNPDHKVFHRLITFCSLSSPTTQDKETELLCRGQGKQREKAGQRSNRLTDKTPPQKKQATVDKQWRTSRKWREGRGSAAVQNFAPTTRFPRSASVLFSQWRAFSHQSRGRDKTQEKRGTTATEGAQSATHSLLTLV